MDGNDILTLDEAMQLQALRELLRRLRDKVASESYGKTSRDTFTLGQLHEAIDVAEGHIFDVLNIADANLHSANARRAIDRALCRA